MHMCVTHFFIICFSDSYVKYKIWLTHKEYNELFFIFIVIIIIVYNNHNKNNSNIKKLNCDSLFIIVYYNVMIDTLDHAK